MLEGVRITEGRNDAVCVGLFVNEVDVMDEQLTEVDEVEMADDDRKGDVELVGVVLLVRSCGLEFVCITYGVVLGLVLLTREMEAVIGQECEYEYVRAMLADRLTVKVNMVVRERALVDVSETLLEGLRDRDELTLVDA